MLAAADESMRQVNGGVYVIAAGVLVKERADEIRTELRALLRPRQERFHWRNEGEAERLAMLKRIVELELFAYAYIHRPPTPRRQDRARAQCLKGLLWDLHQDHIGELVIETRQRRNDRKDRILILQAQEAGIASPDLRYRHARPKEEPLLWLPDAVAGAVSSDEVEATNYVGALGDIVVCRRQVDP